jgi:hypothetical protein
VGWLKAILTVVKYAPAIVEAVKIVLGRHPELIPVESKPAAAKLLRS